jgi:protein-tyrosine phosphatase
MAEAVFKDLVQQAGLSNRIDAESAGIGSWHVGQAPHQGTLAVLKLHHIDASRKKARQLARSDFKEFDYIVAMDQENVTDIVDQFGHKIPRLMDFAPEGLDLDVPDPYYSGNFNLVYQMVLAGAEGLLQHIRQEEKL